VGARHTKVPSTLSPKDYLLIRRLPSPLAGFLIVCSKSYRRNWPWYAAALAALAYRSMREGASWGFIDVWLIFYLLFPAIFALGAQFFRGAVGRYQGLIESVAWGRWEEVLAKVDSVGGSIPAEEIAFRKAGALAGLGRLDEALRIVEPFADNRTIPAWNYWSRLAMVYSNAKRPEDSKAAMEKALELAPDNATLLADMADSEVWLRRNPRRARELLAKARQHALSDVVQAFVLKTEGLIHLEEGRPREARELLEQAFQKASAFRHASALMGALLDKMHAALALAYAAEGDAKNARRHYDLARPRLVALKHDEVITRCEEALDRAR
jgi:tetratricopeptide (TPR) repeat protein